MFGALQLGVVAACVVLFVPLGMAGWHLSRNKVLFFSGALFITLAVCVHVTPYFPSISDFVSSASSAVVLENRDSCISLLHHIVWDVKLKPPTNSELLGLSWDWANSTPVIACEFQKLGRFDASDLLNGSWVVVAGDSQARMIVLSLLTLVLGSTEVESARDELFKRHGNYQIVVDRIGMKLDFIWAPFVRNLTHLVMDFKLNLSYPDVFVMGSGLWHMLHVTNASDYGDAIQSLRRLVVSFLSLSPEFGSDGPVAGSISVRSPHLFWLGIPTFINSLLNTEEKREKMTNEMLIAYDEELRNGNILRESGGPCLLLDMQLLSRKCGDRCTSDGMHYHGAVYDAQVHIMLNALLIESQQKL